MLSILTLFIAVVQLLLVQSCEQVSIAVSKFDGFVSINEAQKSVLPPSLRLIQPNIIIHILL